MTARELFTDASMRIRTDVRHCCAIVPDSAYEQAAVAALLAAPDPLDLGRWVIWLDPHPSRSRADDGVSLRLDRRLP